MNGLQELFQSAAVAYTVAAGRERDVPAVTAVTADSRRAGPQSLFVALPGTRVDGHDYVAAAVEQGCRVVLCNRGCRLPVGVAEKVVHLVTDDTRWAFGRLCAALQGFPAREMVMIGITGTNGKTTASYLLEELIRNSGGEPGVVGTVNYRYRDRVLPAAHTTPDPESLQELLRQMAAAGVSHVIMEVSSHALEQQRVAGIDFDVALFINLSHEHLDYHGDMASYFAGKKRLFDDHLKPRAAAVVVMDSAESDEHGEGYWNRRLVSELLPRAGQLRLFRCGAGGVELRLLDHRITLAGIEALVQSREGVNDHGDKMVSGHRVPQVVVSGTAKRTSVREPARSPLSAVPCDRLQEGQWQLRSSLVGDFNLDNLLGVAGVGLALGMSPETIGAGLAAAEPPPGRLERFSSRRGVEVLVDYAHTPDALGHVLKAVGRLTPGRLIVVFGCGGDRDRAKRPLMGEIAARLADIVVLTSDNPRSEDPAAIMADIRRGLERAGARRGRLESLLAARSGPEKPAAGAGSRASGDRPATVRSCRGYDLIVSRRRAIRDTIYFARSGDVVLVCGKGHETTQIIGDQRLEFDDRGQVREQLAILAPAR